MLTANRKIQSVISIILVVSLGILSTATPGLVLRVMFLFCGAGEIILCFYGEFIKNRLMHIILICVNGFVLAVIFLWSVISAGSLTEYGTRVQTFFQPKILDSAIDEVYQGVNSETIYIEQEISAADEMIGQILDELEHSSGALREYLFLSSRYDPKEVEEIAKIIRGELEEDEKEGSPDFKEIKTDKHVVEIFYKIRISRQLYQYINCIKALESVGINCKEMSIDEYTLMRWDTEVLFAIYSMRQELLDDVAQGVVYDETQYFYYREYKVKLDQYSDTFDYGNWRKKFQPDSAENIVSELDKQIMDFYQKLHMNFQKEID